MVYKNHWSYFDKSIFIYNFLKYNDKEWQKYNPSLHYQNRLRHSDYIKIILQTKFKIVKEQKDLPNATEIKAFCKLKLSPKYKGYKQDDLMIKGSEIVFLK